MRPGITAAGLYTAVAVALLSPLLSRFGAAFPHDAGDPVLNTWILWHESRHLPLTAGWWNAPMFFPASNVLALSEVLLSLLPLSAVVQTITHNPVAAYNAVFAATFPLCGLTVYLLARELTGRADAAFLAGLAFVLAPYRADQLSHLQVLAYFWTPLVLLGLHRYLADRRIRWLVLCAGAWLAQALANGYALFHVSILVGLWMVWFTRSARTALPIAAAWAIGALPMLPIVLRYESVQATLHLTRDINEIRRFGMDLADFAAASPALAVWGHRLGLAQPERAVFPGLTMIAVAIAALLVSRRAQREGTADEGAAPAVARWTRVLVLVSAIAALVAFSVYVIGPWSVGPLSVRDFHKPFSIAVAARLAAFLTGPWVRRMWRGRSVAGFYLLAMAAMYVLALGPEPRLLGRPILYEPPYAWFMRLPGFDALRVPARFAMLAVLCQAVLLAVAASRWATGRRRAPVLTALLAGVVLDGWFWLPVAPVPAGSVQAWPGAAAVIELPLGDADADFGALYRSMTHETPIVNGYSGYAPPHYVPLVHTLRAGRVDVLHELSPSAPLAVVLDRGRIEAPATEAALRTAGFTLVREDERRVVFLVPPRPRPPQPRLGAPLPIASLTASRHPEDVERALDGRITTAWGSELAQAGDEEVTVELAGRYGLGAVWLGMGSFSVGAPSRLEVDVSDDGGSWRPAWRGEVGMLAVRGALDDPGEAPIVLDLGNASGRFIRLRQTGSEPGVPWWIAELRVYGRAP